MKTETKKDKVNKRKYGEELKETYKHFNESVDKKGNDVIQFNLGEIKVPKGFEDKRLILIRDEDNKQYLSFRLVLGVNKEIAEKRRLKKNKKREMIRDVKEKINDAVKNRRTDGLDELFAELKRLENLYKLKET